MGLETAHPDALARLNKGCTLDDFAAAARALAAHGVGLRVFLLVHPPFVPHDERTPWLLRSIDAADRRRRVGDRADSDPRRYRRDGGADGGGPVRAAVAGHARRRGGAGDPPRGRSRARPRRPVGSGGVRHLSGVPRRATGAAAAPQPRAARARSRSRATPAPRATRRRPDSDGAAHDRRRRRDHRLRLRRRVDRADPPPAGPLGGAARARPASALRDRRIDDADHQPRARGAGGSLEPAADPRVLEVGDVARDVSRRRLRPQARVHVLPPRSRSALRGHRRARASAARRGEPERRHRRHALVSSRLRSLAGARSRARGRALRRRAGAVAGALRGAGRRARGRAAR